jgi:hypothetical protein
MLVLCSIVHNLDNVSNHLQKNTLATTYAIIVERFTIKLKMIGYIVKIVDDTAKDQHALISTRRRRHREIQRAPVYRCIPQVACNTGVQMNNNLYKFCNRRFHRYDLPLVWQMYSLQITEVWSFRRRTEAFTLFQKDLDISYVDVTSLYFVVMLTRFLLLVFTTCSTQSKQQFFVNFYWKYGYVQSSWWKDFAFDESFVTVRSENENWRTLYLLREYLPQNEAGSQRLARVVSEQKR